MNRLFRTPLAAAAILWLLPTDAGFAEERTPDKAEVRLVVQTGHTSEVRSVAFSPDGRRVLTGDQDATRLWDVKTGKELLALEVGAPAMAFSQDGKLILTGNEDHVARLWDAETGKELVAFQGHRYEVISVAFAPDGKQILTGSLDYAILWDAQSGKQLKRFKGQVGGKVWSAAVSPDGKQLLTGDGPRTARLLDAESGKERHILRGHGSLVSSVAFSPDGKHLLTGSMDRTARLWGAADGKLLHTFTGHTDPVFSVAFAPDGKHVLTGSYDQTARLWETSGKEVFVLKGHSDRVVSVAFSADSKRLVTGSKDGTARVWDAQTGKELLVLSGRGYSRKPVALSRDGTRLLVGSIDATARLWDARSGAETFALQGHKARVIAVAISPNGKRLLTGSEDQTARLWDAETGKELRVLKCPSPVIAVAFSADDKRLLTASANHAARLWDAESGKELSTVPYPDNVIAAAFSADGKQVLTGGNDSMARLWDAQSGKELRALKCDGPVSAVAFSADGKRLLTGARFSQTARLWDAESGKELRTVHGGSAVAFSADGKRLLTAAQDHGTRVWDAESGKLLLTIKGHLKTVTGVTFSADGKYIVTEDDLTRLWDAGTGNELCRLLSFGGRDGWAVVDPAGRYDASNGGDVEGLHWVVNNEPVALSQLKDRYYDPGLLAKHLGFRKEPLRDVKAFSDVKLYPEVAVAQKDATKPTFNVALTNSGGGIGRVVVLVNGKEQTADARAAGAKADAEKLDVAVDLSKDPRVIPGKKNKVEVVAYNADGSVCSRGMVREFDGPGPAAADPPTIHAVIVGVAKYSNEKLNLNYSAKDAADFAVAFKLAAERLFGADKMHLTLLTTVDGGERPTRANILKALEGLKATKPGDTVVVYLAGHGVTPGGQEGDWYYLTTDAKSADLADAEVRKQVTVSSDELTDLLRAVPAQKQVLILDTCHSGRVVEKFGERRDVPGSQVRAVERVKDRTGMHVLAGCAADAVSYEASRYGQGLLTYSLLEGMHGAKLHAGGFVNVVELFGFAADRVPELARDVGGVQRPTIASPRGDPFNIGQLTVEDQAKVPLQLARPVVLRTNFQLEKPARDTLGLTRRVNDRLREASSAPKGAKLVFVDADEFSGGVQVSGRYKVDGAKVTVSVSLFAGDKELAVTVEGAADKMDELAEKIGAEVIAKIGALGGK